MSFGEPLFFKGTYKPNRTDYPTYSVVGTTGTVAAGAGANSAIFSFRWTQASKKCVIRRVRVGMNSLGTGFTAGVGRFDLMVARAFTAADTGGGVLTITTNNAKTRTSWATTGLQEARISTTAALSAGTRTLDAQPHASLIYGLTNAANTVHLPLTDLYYHETNAPLVLATNEGVIIAATVPATGTWAGYVQFEWLETQDW